MLLRTCLMCLLLMLSTLPGVVHADPFDAAAANAITDLGDGFVVWESNRSGDWRIWLRKLDGSGLRQLSHDEPKRDHACPHIAPDGRHVAFLSLPAGSGYDLKGNPALPLYVVPVDGGKPRKVVDHAQRLSGGNRAVSWLDADRFIYLDKDNRPRIHDLTAATDSEPLLDEPRGLLIDRTFRIAFDRFHFHPYDRDARKLTGKGDKLGGCEPCVTADGRWGVRMSGAGGPITRVDLDTGKTTTLLDKGDPTMPSDRAYLYFPMISSDSRILAFAASKNQHDHFKSDYDLFLVPVDPATLKPHGRPVRYTHHPAVDRYPDVHLVDLPLGRFDVEAPHTLTLRTPDDADATWTLGDGHTARGSRVEHTFRKPGTYDIQAAVGDKTLRGRVTVQPSQPPTVVQALLVEPTRVHVVFDEAITADQLQASFDAKLSVQKHAVLDTGRTLVLHLSDELTEATTLQLTGIRDRAQQPNTMAPAKLTLEPLLWPHRRSNLLLAWSDAQQVTAYDSDGKPLPIDWQLRGQAHVDRHHTLRLARGSVSISDLGPRLTNAIKASNQLSIEAVVTADHLDQTGPARIVSLSSNTSERNFTLGQERGQLVMRLRTPRTGRNGSSPQINLAPLTTGKAVHVIVTYRPGDLRCYIDGKAVLQSDAVQGDFSNWEPMPLTFGDEAAGDRDWAGSLEGVAIYSSVLSPQEVEQHAAARQAIALARDRVPTVRAELELLDVSPTPAADQIAPYRQAVATHTARVRKVLAGKLDAPVIRVSRWAMLDGEPAPDADAKAGHRFTVTLEPFDAQPQLKALYNSDTLDDHLDAPHLWITGP